MSKETQNLNKTLSKNNEQNATPTTNSHPKKTEEKVQEEVKKELENCEPQVSV